MDPNQEIILQFNAIKAKFNNFSSAWKQNQKYNVKSLLRKDYELILNELMNFYSDLILKKENIDFIVQMKLDLSCWNILTDRVSFVLKHEIDQKHLGKNSQMILQNLYSTLIEDLRNTFNFFRMVYRTTTYYENQNNIKNFISNVLTFLGDVKKLKILFNKKFENFKEIVNLIESDNTKDANEAIRLLTYALNNNPSNTRVYSNLGFIYREILNDHISSVYWFIRALSCVDNEMKKIKDNLEKDFNIIRKNLQKIDYNVDSDITSVSFLKYDLEYLPTLYFRIIGIFFMSVDVDELNHLLDNFKYIISRILINYQKVPDQFKINYEVNNQCAHMILLAIFSIHYNINGLKKYPPEAEKVIINNDQKKLLSFGIYNHHLIENLDQANTKPIIKQNINFIFLFTKSICINIREDNYTFIEKYLLILLYWLSLNYDMSKLIFDNEIKIHLQYFNFYLQNDPEIKKFFIPQSPYTMNALSLLVNKINNLILPIELQFIGFLPIHRFFELNKKITVFKVEEVKEIPYINKIVLIHFLNMFGLSAKFNEDIQKKFLSQSLNIKERNENEININQMKEQIINFNHNQIGGGLIKIPQNAKPKEKPLIILDASNVAMRHGNENFSCKGIEIAMKYFTSNGHDVISFLPEYLFRQKNPNSNKKKVVPDNPAYLNELYNKNLVVQTPPQDYDDSYCIQYAKTHNAYIVTNDMFRDHIDKFQDSKQRETEKMWIKEKCISFTFNKDEFLPNPLASFFQNFDINEYNKIK